VGISDLWIWGSGYLGISRGAIIHDRNCAGPVKVSAAPGTACNLQWARLVSGSHFVIYFARARCLILSLRHSHCQKLFSGPWRRTKDSSNELEIRLEFELCSSGGWEAGQESAFDWWQSQCFNRRFCVFTVVIVFTVHYIRFGLISSTKICAFFFNGSGEIFSYR